MTAPTNLTFTTIYKLRRIYHEKVCCCPVRRRYDDQPGRLRLHCRYRQHCRIFRIVGSSGENQFLPFSAAALRPQPVREVGGVELGSREPIFDIVVSAAKKSTFSRLSQNETAKRPGSI